MGRGTVVRALVGGTFSRSKREGVAPNPERTRRPAEQFAMAYADDRRRNLCRTDRIPVQSRMSPSGHWCAPHAFMPIISTINQSAGPFRLAPSSTRPVRCFLLDLQ